MTEINKISSFSWRLFWKVLKNTKYVYSLVWSETKIRIITGYFTVLVNGLGNLAQSGALAILVNQLNNDIDQSRLLLVVVLAVLAIAVPNIFTEIEQYNNNVFFIFLEYKLDILINQKKSELDISAHETPALRDLIMRVVENGVWRVQQFIDLWFYIAQSFLSLIAAAVSLIIIDYRLFIIMTFSAIPLLYAELKYGQKIWSINTEQSERRRRYWDIRNLFDTKSDISELKMFQNTKYFIGQISQILEAWFKDRYKSEQQRFFWLIFSAFVKILAISFSFYLLINKILIGEMQAGTLIFVFGVVMVFSQSISGLFGFIARQHQHSLFVQDFINFLEIPQSLPQSLKPISLKNNKVPEIVFENVSFSYPQVPDKSVLKNISFTIKPGEKLAIIGINGVGKTTLVKLLCRFYDPTGGRILIDGVDLKNIKLESWYGILGTIFQDFSRYYLTVKQLISLGRVNERIKTDRIKSAALKSESNQFIQTWENEFEQMLGTQYQGGIDPSIGQWQKLALARTFYRQPMVYILDEPTSAIDAEAEKKIFEQLERTTIGKTVILISHRFSTVRKADKILVIKDGRVSEYGTHQELLKNNKTYKKLFCMQAKGYQ